MPQERCACDQFTQSACRRCMGGSPKSVRNPLSLFRWLTRLLPPRIGQSEPIRHGSKRAWELMMPERTLAPFEDMADLASSPGPFVIAAERVVAGADGVVHPAAAVVVGDGLILAVGPVSQVLASVGEGTPWT